MKIPFDMFVLGDTFAEDTRVIIDDKYPKAHSRWYELRRVPDGGWYGVKVYVDIGWERGHNMEVPLPQKMVNAIVMWLLMQGRIR